MNKHILALLALAALFAGCSKEPPQNLTPFTGAGTYGHYWTSTLDDGRPYNAYVFNFNRDTAQTSGDSRSNGYPVRPVYAAPAE